MSTQITAETKQGGLLRSALALRTQLSTNPRALGGLIAIVTLVAIYGLLQFGDAIAAKRSAYRQQVSLLHRTAAIGEDSDWAGHAKESSEILKVLEDRLWNFENEGVALANMQDWITSVGRDAKLDKLQVRIKMARPKGLRPDIVQLNATFTAIHNGTSLRTFLDRIAREPHLLIVDQMRVQTRPTSLMQMTLVSYAKLSNPSGAAPK